MYAEDVAPFQGAGSRRDAYPGRCPGLVCSTLSGSWWRRRPRSLAHV